MNKRGDNFLPPRDETTTVAVAMSGGVDSSVTAALLKKSGLRVQGIFMALAQPDLEEQVARVRRVADLLDISLEVVDFAEDFRQEVLEYFRQTYLTGKTPNPCVVCNRHIKFGRLQEAVLNAHCHILATGHYARIVRDPDGKARLFKGRDPKKDQSYFLCKLTRNQLARACFPLGGHTKEEVYGLAAELGLEGVHGKESQDVCFLAGRSVSEFLAGGADNAMAGGSIVTLSGKRIGSHDGVHRFTRGQRRGLGVPDSSPYYVVGLDPEERKVIVGKEADLWRQKFVVRDVGWIAGIAPTFPRNFDVKIRYRHQAAPATVDTARDGDVTLLFQEPQRAPTPGQFAAFYDGDELLGGGEIVLLD